MMSNLKNDSSNTNTVTPRRRELAADYHGGQFTELYKVSSMSGELVGTWT